MDRHELLAACRGAAKHMLAAACVGAVVSGFYAVAEYPDGMPLATIFIGTVIGVFIFAFISLFKLIAGNAIDRLGRFGRALAQAVLFAAGGLAGGVLGLVTGANLVGHSMSLGDVLRGRGIFFMIMAAATALVAATGFSAYEAMRDRFERAAAQLKEREWQQKELELARSIQKRLLPPPRVEGDGFVIEARNLPAHLVAGDFYDVVPLDDGSLVVIVADVAGKGIGASLIMASVKAVLPFVAREAGPRAMSMLNAKLVQELGRREFVALAYARFTPADGSLEVLNAGFPEPYVVSDGSARPLITHGERLPLGIRAGADYQPLRTTLARGERLVFLSDGIPEAPVNGEPLGYERVAEMLVRTKSIDAFLEEVRRAGGGLEDDWTCVVVQRR